METSMKLAKGFMVALMNVSHGRYAEIVVPEITSVASPFLGAIIPLDDRLIKKVYQLEETFSDENDYVATVKKTVWDGSVVCCMNVIRSITHFLPESQIQEEIRRFRRQIIRECGLFSTVRYMPEPSETLAWLLP